MQGTKVLAVILVFFLLTGNSFASTQFEPGDFQLEINGVLLDIETVSTIDNIDFQGDTFVISMSSSQNFKISSAERRQFNISPTTYTARTCPATKSVLEIVTPSSISPIAYTISLGASGSCSSSDGGGGGGGGGAGGEAPGPAPSPTPAPAPAPTTVPTPAPEPSLLEPSPILAPPPSPLIPPPIIPPAEPPLPAPVPETPTPILAPIVQETIQAAQTIGSSAVNIAASFSNGIVQVFNNLTAAEVAFETKIENTIQAIKQINQEVSESVQQLREDKVVVKSVKSVAVPISITVSAVSAGAVTVSASAGSVTIAINLSELAQTLSFSRFYLLGLIRIRRRKPWGKIIDKLSGKPIQSVTVQIYDAEFNKLKDSRMTDAEGRFNAIISPGKYYILVSRKGYEPYQIGGINITSPDQILNLEIGLSPIKEAWNLEYAKKINIWNALKRFMELINPYLLAFGTLISAIALIIVPNLLNYLTLGIYLLLDILKIYSAIHLIKPFGKIIDEATGESLSLAVVRIFEEEKNWLLATKVTDEQGRFNFLLAPGRYYLTFSRAGYQDFKSEVLNVTKTELPSLNIKLKRAG